MDWTTNPTTNKDGMLVCYYYTSMMKFKIKNALLLLLLLLPTMDNTH